MGMFIYVFINVYNSDDFLTLLLNSQVLLSKQEHLFLFENVQ